jgi:hydroxypyruvate isomerase
VPRLAANLSTMFREWPFLDRFDAAAEAGFSLVECQFPYESPAERIAERLTRNGLAMIMFNTPPGDLAAGQLGHAALAERFDDLRASVVRAADYAGLLEVGLVHLLAGRAPPSGEALSAFRRALDWAVDYLVPRGITLLLEPINATRNPDYFLTDFDLAARLVGALEPGSARLQFDTFHCKMNGLDPDRALARWLPIIGHVQISAVPDRGEPDSDDRRFLRRLDEAGYTGVVGCEYVPRCKTLGGLAWRERFERGH